MFQKINRTQHHGNRQQEAEQERPRSIGDVVSL